MTQATLGPYELLGVSRSASAEDIESSFRKLEQEFHSSGKPKNIDDVEWLRRLVWAHQILTDAQRRKTYDRTGMDPGSSSTNPAPGYDFERIKAMKQSIDAQITAHRTRWVWDIWKSFWR